MNITAIRTFLQGKKTYGVGIFTVVYAAGAALGYWHFSLDVLTAVGGAGLMTIAAKVERVLGALTGAQDTTTTTTPTNPTSGTSSILALAGAGLLVLGLASGCATKLAEGGAYAPAQITVVTNADSTLSTNVVQLAAPDFAFYTVDSSFELAYNITQTCFKIERDNRALLWKISPQIKHTLDTIRPTAVDVVKRYGAARTAYMLNPTPAGLGALQNLLSRAQNVASAVQAATIVPPGTPLATPSK